MSDVEHAVVTAVDVCLCISCSCSNSVQNETFDPSAAKKKKSKKKVNFEIDDAAPVAADASTAAPEKEDEDDLEAMFATKKKKKKKSSAVATDVAEQATEGSMVKAESDIASSPYHGTEDVEEESEEKKSGFKFAFEEGKEPWLGTDRDYTYPELLTRFYHILYKHNPELGTGERRRYTIVPPSVHREGSKKTLFANVAEIAKRMNRNPEHVIQFLFTELGTQGSVDAEGRLIIRGRFQPKQIENVLRRYIVEYVTCKTCKSPNTHLVKENRLFFMQCDACQSTRSVSAIKSGFMAQVGRRAKKPE